MSGMQYDISLENLLKNISVSGDASVNSTKFMLATFCVSNYELHISMWLIWFSIVAKPEQVYKFHKFTSEKVQIVLKNYVCYFCVHGYY